MRRRYFAAFAAALLLFTGMTGCKSKPSTITTTEQIDGPVGLHTTAEPAPGDIDFPVGTERIEDEQKESASDDETKAPAESASVPAALEGELTPIQLEPTVNVKTQPSLPNSADDDQEGDYTPPPATAAPETKPDRPAGSVTPNEAPIETTKNNTHQEQNTPTALNTKGGSPSGDLQITVETVEVTLDQLKAQNYQVDLTVTLDKNPGIIYSEWGLQLDNRCTYEADSDGLPFDTVSFINEEKAFLWTAWSSGGNATARKGALLTLHVKVPREAKSGSAYIISYAPESLAPAPHLWQNEEISYVATNEVGWTNGGILVK